MLIGLGGGAASSVGSGQSSSDLDFASVQRGNPEIQRRAQEVIDRCWALGDANPIVLIHDVGAGGLSNAVPEAIAHSQRGGRIDLRKIPSAEPGLSPMEIWCNEAQERYVLALAPGSVERFAALCARERCPFAVIGEITADGELRVSDALSRDDARRLADRGAARQAAAHDAQRAQRAPPAQPRLRPTGIGVEESLEPAAASADRRRQVLPDHHRRPHRRRARQPRPDGRSLAGAGGGCGGEPRPTTRAIGGEAMAMGERAPVALLDAPASGRLAVAEAITNIMAADIEKLTDVRLSANWMAACGAAGEDAALYATVRAVSWMCARHSASPFRWARTRCRCARIGPRRTGRARCSRRCR